MTDRRAVIRKVARQRRSSTGDRRQFSNTGQAIRLRSPKLASTGPAGGQHHQSGKSRNGRVGSCGDAGREGPKRERIAEACNNAVSSKTDTKGERYSSTKAIGVRPTGPGQPRGITPHRVATEEANQGADCWWCAKDLGDYPTPDPAVKKQERGRIDTFTAKGRAERGNTGFQQQEHRSRIARRWSDSGTEITLEAMGTTQSCGAAPQWRRRAHARNAGKSETRDSTATRKAKGAVGRRRSAVKSHRPPSKAAG